MAAVMGFVFSSVSPILKNKFKKTKPNDWLPFLLGLAFTQLVIVGISVWCWDNVDRNWLVLYSFDPNNLGIGAYFLYMLFPLIYIGTYQINKLLHQQRMARSSLFIAATSWLLFTLIIFPDFVTLFKGNDIPMHGIDYPPQVLWNLTQFPAGNAYWFLPFDYGTFFMFFFFIATSIVVGIELLGILLAAKNNFLPRSSSNPQAGAQIPESGTMNPGEVK